MKNDINYGFGGSNACMEAKMNLGQKEFKVKISGGMR